MRAWGAMRARARGDRRETLVAWRGMMATRRGRCDVRGAVEGWWMDDSLCVCAMCASGGVGGRRARAGRRPTIDRCMVCVTLETDLGRRRLARDARRFFRKTLISSTRRLLWKLASTSSSVSYSRRTRASWMSSARVASPSRPSSATAKRWCCAGRARRFCVNRLVVRRASPKAASSAKRAIKHWRRCFHV